MIPQKAEVRYSNIRIQYNCSQANRFIDMLREQKAKLQST